MHKYLLSVILLSTILISCKTSYTHVGDKNANYIPYYLKVNEADSLHIVGNYKQSQQILDSLFKKYEPLNQESYGEYITFLKNKVIMKDYRGIDIVVRTAIQDYGYKIEHRSEESLMDIAIKKSKFSNKDLIGFYDVYTSKLNLKYRFALENMIKNDQRVRTAVPRDTSEFKGVDRENAENIKLLIAKYGYPSVKRIGRYDYNNKTSHVSTLFLHATKEARESYILDLMFQSVKKGECSPTDYATVYDKYLMSTGKYGYKVLYGELRSSKKSIDEAVINPRKLDSIRKSIGLEHLDYVRWKVKKVTGIDMDDL